MPLALPTLKIVLTGTEYGYRRDDEVFVIPATDVPYPYALMEQFTEAGVTVHLNVRNAFGGRFWSGGATLYRASLARNFFSSTLTMRVMVSVITR